MPDIRVSAAVIVDRTGRVLVVRKQGTTRFMQPGGKPEPGETAAQTLIRELDEELSLHVEESDLEPLGTFVSAAANEPGHRVIADAFAMHAEPEDVVVQAELAAAMAGARRPHERASGTAQRGAPPGVRLALTPGGIPRTDARPDARPAASRGAERAGLRVPARPACSRRCSGSSRPAAASTRPPRRPPRSRAGAAGSRMPGSSR